MTTRAKRTCIVCLGALLALAALPAGAGAATYEIDPAHSSVGFRIRHLVGRVSGSFTRFSGSITFDEKQPAKSKVSATIEAASIDTQNQKRDDHLRSADFFDVTKYPTLTFASRHVSVVGKNHFRVLGDLTMHGVTRQTILDVAYGGQMKNPMGPGQRAGFTATTRVNRKDFGIVWNKTLDTGGAMLGDNVEITLEIEAAEKQ